MAIDIRAKVTCSLGTLISGSISDDYLQGSGLVKTRGSCVINGLITPAVGSLVVFNYTKGNITRNIPRTLRVLSSFADPFRKVTTVELGCKLTYLSDLQEPLKWTAFDDSLNSDYTEDDQRIITIPISASSAMNKCLAELGITANRNPLTNKFSIAEFDFGAGYVQVLSDLLVSESYFGYLNASEVLQIVALSQDGGTGPVILPQDIIDLGPIGVGQLPGEAVIVSYSTLKLKQPEFSTFTIGTVSPEEEEQARQEISRVNWELDETEGPVEFYYINYTDSEGKPQVQEYSGNSYSTTTTNYGTITVFNQETNEPETREVVTSRFIKGYGPLVSVAQPFAKAALEFGLSFSGRSTQLSATNVYYDYFDNGNTVVTRQEVFKTTYEQAASLGIDLIYTVKIGDTFVTQLVDVGLGIIQTELIRTVSSTVGDASKEVTTEYKVASDTQPGQQAIAAIRETLTTAGEAQVVINDAIYGLVFDGTTVRSRRTFSSIVSPAILPSRPSPATRINQSYSSGGDPNNGWRTESKAEIELALGSATAQRRIEFSMPYAPDDFFYKTGGFYGSIQSDAPRKAITYGRAQNRLLLGNRNGINLQVAPERLPVAPFDPIYVQAAGLTSLYRANGNQWAFDSSGIVCSTDALYWGVAGKT
jgi:hypothetical protein